MKTPPSNTARRPAGAALHGRPGGSALGNVIRRSPLITFFVLAFGFSWALWTPYILSNHGLGIWDYVFPGGPMGSQLLGVLPGAYCGPIGAALLVTAIADGRPGLRVWRKRMTNFRVRWYWYLVVILAVPTVLILATTVLSGVTPVLPPVAVLMVFLPGLLLQVITTGLAEEPGWREFAMPRMQERFSPVVATFIVGLLWGLWHMPLYLTEWGGKTDTLLKPLEFLITVIAFSYVMTWVFNLSGESMPLIMLLHASINNFISMIWSSVFPTVSPEYGFHVFLAGSLVCGAIVLIATRGRLGRPRAPLTKV
ncbi:type II CAAX prenyl endopeptidase Rce1 family protein [Amycolatopsis sp. lyj-90]|uniref:CPBP family glutamic-type intramembrane protease n=1 Tax=Amycolatopsis sp. lyj-90 TaxID=2789285 RepID=UPI00397A57F6